MPQEDQSALYIDGQRVTMDEFTFREQRQIRDHIRTLAPENDTNQASEADIVPAMICVYKRRDNPKYSLEDALDVKPGDLMAPEDPTSGD